MKTSFGKKAPLFALMGASTISLVGDMFALVAVPWFVLQTTGSAVKTGLAAFFVTLATVLAAFFGGAIVDRLGFKRTSLLADVLSGVTVALIPLLYATVGLEFWQLLALVFAGSFLDAPGVTAREALMPELAERAGWTLEQAGAAIQAVERGARMLGAPLAGAMIAVFGAQNVLWFDAASFGVSALIVLAAVPGLAKPGLAEQPGLKQQAEAKPRYLEDLKAGLRFIFSDRLLRAIVLLIVITNFLDASSFSVLYPVYIDRYFGNALDLGLMVAAGGGGSLVSAVLYGAWGFRLPRRAVFFGGFLLATARYWVMALVPPFWVVIGALFIAGFASGPINPILTTIEFERIPVGYRGRVLGTITALAYMAIPLGVLVSGFLLEAVDVRLVLALTGGAYTVTLLIFLVSPWMRGMNERGSVGAVQGEAATGDF